MHIKSARFLQSNICHQKCPQAQRLEFAFIGRSNVGKSSLINMLVAQKNLAKTSSTPGKTQYINHFLINEAFYIVDLPGYGWAKSSKKNQTQWKKMVENYLLYREHLVYVYVLLDSRLSPQTIDHLFIHWLGSNQIPFGILFTKIDKQSPCKTQHTITKWKETLSKDWKILPTWLLSSAKNKIGKQAICQQIEQMIQTIEKRKS